MKEKNKNKKSRILFQLAVTILATIFCIKSYVAGLPAWVYASHLLFFLHGVFPEEVENLFFAFLFPLNLIFWVVRYLQSWLQALNRAVKK